METLQDQIAMVIEELTRLQTLPVPYRDKDDDFPFPRMIGAGNGGSIIVSRKIDDTIVMVADQLRSASVARMERQRNPGLLTISIHAWCRPAESFFFWMSGR